LNERQQKWVEQLVWIAELRSLAPAEQKVLRDVAEHLNENVLVAKAGYPKPDYAMQKIFAEIYEEILIARRNFPSNHHRQAALAEEAGEVTRELLEFYYENSDERKVVHECIQTAAMAIRLALEGDPAFNFAPVDAPEDETREIHFTQFTLERYRSDYFGNERIVYTLSDKAGERIIHFWADEKNEYRIPHDVLIQHWTKINDTET